MRQSVSYLIEALTLASPINGQPNTIGSDSTSDNSIEELNNKLELKNKQLSSARARILRNNILGATVLLLTLSAIALLIYRPAIIEPFLSGWYAVVIIFVFFYMLIFDMVFLINYVRLSKLEKRINEEIRDLENEIDLAGIGIDSRERRAEKLFKLHQLELEKYCKQNQRQGNRVFNAGIFFILVGFLIVGISINLVSNGVQNEKIVAILGGIGTILSDFIAAKYLKMFSDTTKALTDFQNRLVTTHNLMFSNFLVSKIKKEELRDSTLSAMVSDMAKGRLQEGEKRNQVPVEQIYSM
jgi:hypothetical protein